MVGDRGGESRVVGGYISSSIYILFVYTKYLYKQIKDIYIYICIYGGVSFVGQYYFIRSLHCIFCFRVCIIKNVKI